MKVIHSPASCSGVFERPRVALGTFDGVHLGHQRVLRELLSWARSAGDDAVVVTFDRKPRNVLNGSRPEQVTSLRHRLALFERLGMDGVVVLKFDKALAGHEPEDFVEEIVVKGLGASGVLLGHDTRFGRGGRGDIALLERLGKKMGFEACSVPVVELDGEPVSSTRVRQAVLAGDLEEAERLLGRRVSVLGTVVVGTRRGRGIGYPTANLDLEHEVHLPEGVYATRTAVAGRWHDSVTNIGRAPTLAPGGARYRSEAVVVETHLMDYSGELYGEDVEVEFVGFLRAEEVFDSPKALAGRIAADVEAALARLATATEADKGAT